jgi:hypothetical protein
VPMAVCFIDDNNDSLFDRCGCSLCMQNLLPIVLCLLRMLAIYDAYKLVADDVWLFMVCELMMNITTCPTICPSMSFQWRAARPTR